MCTRVQVADGLVGAAGRAGSGNRPTGTAGGGNDYRRLARRQRGHVLSLNRMLWLVRPQKTSDARALFEPLEIPSIVMRHIKESVEASPMVTPLINRLCACVQPQTPDSVLP